MKICVSGLLIFAVVAAISCTNTPLQPLVVGESALDDRLAVRGQVCTAQPDPSGFPVKILFLIDSSGSMCISDGPGSQGPVASGLCEQVGTALAAQGITEPGRVRALKELVHRLAPQANTKIAIDLFESMITHLYPVGGGGFASASGATDQLIGTMQAKLGKATDYQGAMAYAGSVIAQDAQKVKDKSQLIRTKYIVVFLTDGTPYPRCTSNDPGTTTALPADAYATADEPWKIWKDNPGGMVDGQPEFCNSTEIDPNADPDDPLHTLDQFIGGSDRNQNSQIFSAVDQLMALKKTLGLGELHLHTVLIFNKAGVDAAAAMGGQQVYDDVYNGMAPAENAHKVAAWTLQQMAEKGNGTYQEFTDRDSIKLGSLDYSSLASRYVAKTLLASNAFAYPSISGPVVDSDGDGLIDDQDSDKVQGTNTFIIDSDGDGFTDGFELAHANDNFDPLKPDPRGCKAGTDKLGHAFNPRGPCTDSDGDGISDVMETYLGTDPGLADTDADGIPDGMEVMLGLDPLKSNDASVDTDLDGTPDITEILSHTNPLLDDRAVHARDGYRYQMTPTVQDDGSICYDFLISNIRLLTPSRPTGQVGYNYITVTFADAPESGVAQDYGEWRQACVFAQFSPPSLRSPANPEITITDSDFRYLDSIYLRNATRARTTILPDDGRCKGAVP